MTYALFKNSKTVVKYNPNNCRFDEILNTAHTSNEIQYFERAFKVLECICNIQHKAIGFLEVEGHSRLVINDKVIGYGRANREEEIGNLGWYFFDLPDDAMDIFEEADLKRDGFETFECKCCGFVNLYDKRIPHGYAVEICCICYSEFITEGLNFDDQLFHNIPISDFFTTLLHPEQFILANKHQTKHVADFFKLIEA